MYIVVPFVTERRGTFAFSVLIGQSWDGSRLRQPNGEPTVESLVPGFDQGPAGP